MDAFVARHPIFNARNKIHGYELAFREGFDEFYDSVETDRADVDFLTYVNFSELIGHTKGLLAFPRELLINNFPALLSGETLTVAISPQVEADDEVIAACRRLYDAGYEIMLDSAVLSNGQAPLLPYASAVRVDLDDVEPSDSAAVCKEIRRQGLEAMARGVNSDKQFDQAADAGYQYFQGDFFAQPQISAGREVSAGKLNYLRLLNEVNKSQPSYEDLEKLIVQDVTLTYRLLQMINSAWYGLRYEVRSIRHALVLLGPEEIRVWASLLALRDIGQDKPPELIRRSLMRARIAKELAQPLGMDERASELLLMGMFSLIDALTDVPMDKVLEDLPLSEDVKIALLEKTGRMGLPLKMIVAYEGGRWDEFSALAASLNIDEHVMPELFKNSLKWANGILFAI